MNTMMMTINRKKILVGSVLLAALISFIFIYTEKKSLSQDMQLELQTFQLKDGWGYQILIDGKVFIHQPTIPAIDTEKSFPDKVSAGKVGMLVLKRIKSNENPAVSPNEINQLLSF